MNFSLNNIGVANLFAPDFNAVTFSLFGMALVFAGLIVISLYVLVLPKLLLLFAGKKQLAPQNEQAAEAKENGDEKEVLIAIATAFYLYQNFPDDNQKITWKSHGDVDSLWQISGRVQGMSQRTHVSRRFFPHK